MISVARRTISPDYVPVVSDEIPDMDIMVLYLDHDLLIGDFFRLDRDDPWKKIIGEKVFRLKATNKDVKNQVTIP